jgi:hypothetical protein
VDPSTGDYLIDQSWLKLHGPNPLDLRLFYKTGRAPEHLGNSYQATLAEDTKNTGSLSINWLGRATTIYRQTSTTSPYLSTNPDEMYDQVQSLGGGVYALVKRTRASTHSRIQTTQEWLSWSRSPDHRGRRLPLPIPETTRLSPTRSPVNSCKYPTTTGRWYQQAIRSEERLASLTTQAAIVPRCL